MKATYQLTAPDDVLASLTLTGTVGDFRELLKTIRSVNEGQYYPLNQLLYAIIDTIEASAKHFEAVAEDKPTPTNP